MTSLRSEKDWKTFLWLRVSFKSVTAHLRPKLLYLSSLFQILGYNPCLAYQDDKRHQILFAIWGRKLKLDLGCFQQTAEKVMLETICIFSPTGTTVRNSHQDCVFSN